MDELDDMADDDAILDASVRDTNQLEYAEGMAAVNLPLDLHADRHAMYAESGVLGGACNGDDGHWRWSTPVLLYCPAHVRRLCVLLRRRWQVR